MRLPNLLVAGVSKAGTSSLFDYLGRHPAVGQADTKEIRYFNALRHGQPLGPVEGYAAHFAGLTQTYAMEATPGYFYGGHQVATALNEVCDRPRVVVSLRDPVSRCWSWYRFEKTRLRLPQQMTFDDYLDRCFLMHGNGTDHLSESTSYWGVGGGCYDQWLPDWTQHMGERLKVVFFDDLTGDPHRLVRDLYDWLDLDSQQANLSDLRAVNVTQPYKHKTAQQVAVKVNRRGERFFRAHPRLKRTLRSAYYALNREQAHEQMSDQAQDRLVWFFRPHLSRLAEQLVPLGLSLPEGWVR